MKKLTTLILGLLALLPAKADEGMWTLYDLPQAVYSQMQAYGFSLPYEQLYSGNDAVKGSVVLFGGFCSGVVVSPDGLVFTNHHCGFEAIRSHSTVEHDYMKDGFYAKSFKDELPNENLFVSFMVSQEDVTARLQALGIDDMDYDRQDALIDSVAAVMTDSVKRIDKSYHVEIDPFYEGNQYFATTYQLFPDVRLVFTVPKSMGKFGGETDNWMWPRQTCDFSVLGAERALQAAHVGQGVDAGIQGRRLRHDHGLPRKHGALPLFLRHTRDARRWQRDASAGAHAEAGHHEAAHGRQRGRAHQVRLEVRPER